MSRAVVSGKGRKTLDAPGAELSPQIVAGGGVVHRAGKKGLEFLVVYRAGYDDWTHPKGKLEKGESLQDAAEREVEEETGYVCRVGPELGTIAYFAESGRRKIVRYWLMEAAKGRFKPNSEIDAAEWLPAKEAASRLTYGRDKTLLRWATRRLDHPQAGRVYLIRHAHAGRRDQHRGPAAERPLSGRGGRQALQLVREVSRVPVTRIVSSPLTRCLQTVAPIAARLDMEVEPDKRLAEGTTPKAVGRLLAQFAGEAAVVCTHGDVVADILGGAAAAGARLEGDVAWGKASMWVLDTRRRKVLRGRYHPAPA